LDGYDPVIQTGRKLFTRRWLIAISALAFAMLALWFAFGSGDDGARSLPAGPMEDEAPVSTPPDRPAASLLPAPQQAPASAAPAQPAEPAYRLPLVPPGPDDPHDEPMHPHPITPEHVRIHKINQLIQSLNDAMSARDVKRMRELIDEYRTLDPKDEDVMQLGYKVIADCLEYPGHRTLASARRFYDTHRASTLRRFVRRVCFEQTE
jgi:hypothetical protein